MNRAEELCHSSGPWKKHKYFKKIGEGANAVYKYARDKAAETADTYITGKSAKEDLDRETSAKERYDKHLEDKQKKIDEMADNRIWNPEKYDKEELMRLHDTSGPYYEWSRKAGERKEAAQKEYDRSLAGKIDKAKKALTPQETTTITDTKTGKTRTPSKPKSQSDTVNLKKKKLKHDDLGVAYISHAETQSSVERGQEKINRLFGKRFS